MARRWFIYAAAIPLVVFAAACDDASPPSAPQDGPSFAKAPLYACVFNGNPSLSSAINDYFTLASEKTTANGFAAAIQTAYNTAPAPNYALAQGPGFDLLKYVGTVARLGHGASNAAGAVVIQQTLQCMYKVPATDTVGGAWYHWPTDPHFDFASALSFGDAGAYYVRGDAAKDEVTAPVVANDAANGNVSVLAPASTSDWPTTLGQRVLIYGNYFRTTPDAEPTGYDWKLIPRSATFNPNGVVALCSGLGITFGGSDMVNQVGVGVLAFIDAESLCLSPVVAMQGRSLLQRISQFAARALSPEPAYATAVLTSTGGGLGGAKGDPFVAVPVTDLTLEWGKKPSSTMRLNKPDTSTVKASTLVNGVKTYVNGACIVITGTNNNGTGTALDGSKSCDSPSSIQVSAATTFLNLPNRDPGYATLIIIPKKTGGLTLTATPDGLVNLGDVTPNNTITFKTNVKP